MTQPRRWRDTGHRERAVETAGSPEAFETAVGQMLDQARGWRLVQLRQRRGLTQAQVAARLTHSTGNIPLQPMRTAT
jgi:hypothetical protein